jgi:acetolactate synthase I/II/III large subunit
MVAALRAAGIDAIFGVPGGAVSPLFDALVGSDVDVIVAQHEGMAAYEAQGWSRATGKPGVVLVTSGPGVLNATTPIAAARLDEVPLLVLAGDAPSSMAARGVLQDGGPSGLDIVGVMSSLTKRVETLAHPGRALASLHQALAETMAHPRGPVLLNLPMDIGSRTVPEAHVEVRPISPRAADRKTIQRIGARLMAASRPVLWLGIGARVAGVGSLARRVAEQADCVVITDIEAKGLIPENHPRSLGLHGVGSRGRAEAYLEEGVDLLLAIGARLDDTTTNGFSPTLASMPLVQLDHDAQRLSRAYPAAEAIHCDLLDTLRDLSEELPEELRDSCSGAVLASVESLDRAPHDPAAVITALQRVLPPETVFTADIGNHMIFAAQHLRLEHPNTFHMSNGLGGMTSGIGLAIGLAHGGARPVVGICGDGAFRMAAMELASCATHRVPVILAVLDDQQLGMVEHGMMRVFGRTEFTRSPAIDIPACARALGATAIRVDTENDLRAALECCTEGPLVLHFPIRSDIQPHNPRADVFSFPFKES